MTFLFSGIKWNTCNSYSYVSARIIAREKYDTMNPEWNPETNDRPSSPDVKHIYYRQGPAERFNRWLSDDIPRKCCLASIVSLILGTYFK